MNKIWKSYWNGLRNMSLSLPLTVLLYGCNLLLALVAVLPLVGRLQEGLRGSMLPEALLEGFDFTALSELLRHGAQTLATVLAQSWWIVVVYFLFGVFSSAGTLYLIERGQSFSFGAFLDGARLYLGRFFRLTVSMTVCQILAACAVYLPLFLILKYLAVTVESEATLFWVAVSGAVLHLFVALLLLIVSCYGKVGIVAGQEKRVRRAIASSLGLTFRNLGTVAGLFSLFIFTGLLLALVFHLLAESMKGPTGPAILLVFLLQQLFMLARVFVRIWVFDSHYRLYRQVFNQTSTGTALS